MIVEYPFAGYLICGMMCLLFKLLFEFNSFMISVIKSEYYIFGIANEGGVTTKPYNFLVMEKGQSLDCP